MISKGKVWSVFIVSACGKIVEHIYMALLLRAIDFKKYAIMLHIMLIVIRQNMLYLVVYNKASWLVMVVRLYVFFFPAVWTE